MQRRCYFSNAPRHSSLPSRSVFSSSFNPTTRRLREDRNNFIRGGLRTAPTFTKTYTPARSLTFLTTFDRNKDLLFLRYRPPLGLFVIYPFVHTSPFPHMYGHKRIHRSCRNSNVGDTRPTPYDLSTPVYLYHRMKKVQPYTGNRRLTTFEMNKGLSEIKIIVSEKSERFIRISPRECSVGV